jgi:hypothetical protein
MLLSTALFGSFDQAQFSRWWAAAESWQWKFSISGYDAERGQDVIVDSEDSRTSRVCSRRTKRWMDLFLGRSE